MSQAKTTTLALQIAAVVTKMPQQDAALHSIVTVSRVAPSGRPRSASVRRSCKMSEMALARFFLAADLVRPARLRLAPPGSKQRTTCRHAQ
jgi:hypothetical protein